MAATPLGPGSFGLPAVSLARHVAHWLCSSLDSLPPSQNPPGAATGNFRTASRSISEVKAGFTLIETLTVLAIIAVLALGTFPAVQGVLDSQKIQGASAMVRDQFQVARQIAITKNHPIQCRLYQTSNGYFAIKSVLDGTETPVTRLVYLPAKIIITNNQNFSTLLVTSGASASGVTSSSDTTGPYIAFRFRADGSTDLISSSTYTMTLLAARKSTALTQLPSNFITLQLDPQTGKTIGFQP